MKAIVAALCLAMLLASPLPAQNRILVVTDSESGILLPGIELDSLLRSTGSGVVYASYVPDTIIPSEFAVLILASRSAAVACRIESIDQYVKNGGVFICGGGIPYYLSFDPNIHPAKDWYGCDYYTNASGAQETAEDAAFLSLARGAELDNPGCGIQFGAFRANIPKCKVIARWNCPGKLSELSICMNDYGSGHVAYMSRMNNNSALCGLLTAIIAKYREYVWGDFNSSGFVDIDDVTAILRRRCTGSLECRGCER